MITAFILMLLAQPITDLGVITPSRAIVLEKCTNRTDFAQFVVEVQGMNKTEWSSNYVRFSTTNAILKIEDFAPLLPGPAVMAVKSICADGEESPISLFKLDIRRDGPKPPQAKVVSTGSIPTRSSLSNYFHSRRMNAAMPPAPVGAMVTNAVRESVGEPLPNGKPETYSDGILQQQRFYAERLGKRRNE